MNDIDNLEFNPNEDGESTPLIPSSNGPTTSGYVIYNQILSFLLWKTG